MKRLITCGLLIGIMNATVYAYTGFGVCNYGKQTVPSVICYGPTVLKQTTINGDIKVTGNLKAENISVRDILVQGSVDISNSEVSGSVNVNGDFRADHVEFKKGIALQSSNATLNQTKVNGLVSMTSADSTPYLQVQCGSVVTGSVLFDGKAGVIQITGDALVQGKVVNGSMEFVKRDCE